MAITQTPLSIPWEDIAGNGRKGAPLLGIENLIHQASGRSILLMI
jgi:hypothetical protein